MMNSVLSVILSFLLTAGHVNFVIGTHFCGGEAVETRIMLGNMHLGCGMPDVEGSSDDQEKPNTNELCFDKAPCCENEYRIVQFTDEFLKDAAPQAMNAEFAPAFIYKSLNPGVLQGANHQLYTENISPHPEKDTQALFQTFLN